MNLKARTSCPIWYFAFTYAAKLLIAASEAAVAAGVILGSCVVSCIVEDGVKLGAVLWMGGGIGVASKRWKIGSTVGKRYSTGRCREMVLEVRQESRVIGEVAMPKARANGVPRSSRNMD